MLGSLFNKSRTRAEINRENARKSTGPRTAAGKGASSRNAIKEGFTASFAIVAPEDQQCYDEFLNLRAELQPAGTQEEDLFRRISLASWNIRRIEKLTFALYEETGADPLASDDDTIVARLERYTRHQTLNERSYYRGIKQLRLLQDSRPHREPAAPAQPKATPPKPYQNPQQNKARPLPAMRIPPPPRPRKPRIPRTTKRSLPEPRLRRFKISRRTKQTPILSRTPSIPAPTICCSSSNDPRLARPRVRTPRLTPAGGRLAVFRLPTRSMGFPKCVHYRLRHVIRQRALQ